LKRARALNVLDLLQIDLASWALAYGEALRTGDDGAAKPLAAMGYLTRHQSDSFGAFVRGEAADWDEHEFDPPLRAAAQWIRSRNNALTAAEREKLRAAANENDCPPGAVIAAMGAWPP
jgi:hypothetical protein